jgi:hypothetical protein
MIAGDPASRQGLTHGGERQASVSPRAQKALDGLVASLGPPMRNAPYTRISIPEATNEGSTPVAPASERLPDGGGLRAIFRMQDAVDYYDGEVPPAVE